MLMILSSASTVYGQQKLAFNAGYKYANIHSGYLGAEYRLNNNSGKNTHGLLNIGVGSLIYSRHGKAALLPELHLNKTWKHFLTTEISVTPQYLQPSAGITFFNLTRLQFGYSIPFNHSDFKGFAFSFHILIGRSPFYDEITIY